MTNQYPGAGFFLGPNAAPQQFFPFGGGAPQAQPHGAGEVRDVATIRNLCTVLAKSVKVLKSDASPIATVTFACHATVPAVAEVHVAIREHVRNGAIVFVPNQQKPPPTPITVVVGDAVEVSTTIDLSRVSAIEQTYDRRYPKQIPIAITLSYEADVTDLDGNKSRRQEKACQVEYTYVAILPAVKVFKRMLQVPGAGLFAIESLFGAEHEEGVTMGTVAGDAGEPSRSPTTAEAVAPSGGAGSPGGAQIFEDDEESLCVVCITNGKDTAVMPCRHLCLCKECAEELRRQTNKCPICRGPISQLITKKRQ